MPHSQVINKFEHNNYSGPARGFGYTVSWAFLFQVYGIFWSKFGYKVFSFSWILGIWYMIQKFIIHFSVLLWFLRARCSTRQHPQQEYVASQQHPQQEYVAANRSMLRERFTLILLLTQALEDFD